MGGRIYALAQQITGKDTIDECSVEELKHIAKRFPYFASAQFLLLQKLKQVNSSEAEGYQKKAVLFYHDPLLFDYFISADKFYTEEEIVSNNEVHLAPGKEFDGTDSNKEEDAGRETILKANETTAPLIEEEHEVIANDDAVAKDELSNAEQPHIEIINDASQNAPDADVIQEQPVNTELNPAGSAQNLSSIINDASTELSFEPYHTIDYFASQGIKISQEELPKDKLGKQLKSFTEWLKTMKRLPSTAITQTVETSAEKKIESMADLSVTDSNVITEAMAEVWEKQGNLEKAIETYNKLSLLNPSKTAYFAAKIENLKQL